MLQRSCWLCLWLWPKSPPFGEKKNRASNQERIVTFEKTQREYVQEQRKRKLHKKKERAAKREPLREKEDSQERESCAWKIK